MRVWAPSPGETFFAHFNAGDDHRLITVRFQKTDQQINDSTLELRPLTALSKVPVVLI
jgi:hypothetical protein